ncbi:NYN domain-containing protein [Schlesneria paludicola]|uniref:NYN domain-containing protein n=1 Tax=Schlesneria paludicola TaxID=360056 RepID=UPI00029B1BB1|nr:NYN domain-containing protein [Schlesneria paludicola]
MSASFLIVDGYNLMHAAGLAREKYGPGDLARKRTELLFKLAQRLTSEEKQRCTVVFDAIDAPPNLPRRSKHAEITVLFAQPGQEADEVIETLIQKHSASRRLTVVSSDHRLQTAIRRRRGIPLDSELFLKRLEASYREMNAPIPAGQPSKRPESELEFWLQEFNAIQPEQLRKEIDESAGLRKSDWQQGIEQLEERIKNPDDLEAWLNEPDQHRVMTASENRPTKGRRPKPS